MRSLCLFFFVLWAGAEFLGAAPATQGGDRDPMAGVPGREELRRRRARATNAPASFDINPTTQKLEVRNVDGKVVEEYTTGTVGRLLDIGGYELKVSFGRDDKSRLSMLVRPGPAQAQPVQVSLFRRRLILPPGTSVSASLGPEDGWVTIEPSLTGTIYYLDTEPTAVDVPPDKVKVMAAKNLVRIGRELEQGRLPDEDMVDAVVQGKIQIEERQTPKNNAGVALGTWLQNATTSLMGLPSGESVPAATVVKVTAGTPELSAPAHGELTPNADTKPVVSTKNSGKTPVTQNVKVIALRADFGDTSSPRKPFMYEEGSKKDLANAARRGVAPRPLEDPSLALAPPSEHLNEKPPGDVAGNAVWKCIRSFLGVPEASTVNEEASKLSGKTSPSP